MRVVVTALLALVLVTCAVAAAETDLQRAVGELKAGRAAEAVAVPALAHRCTRAAASLAASARRRA